VVVAALAAAGCSPRPPVPFSPGEWRDSSGEYWVSVEPDGTTVEFALPVSADGSRVACSRPEEIPTLEGTGRSIAYETSLNVVVDGSSVQVILHGGGQGDDFRLLMMAPCDADHPLVLTKVAAST
jgi:hypothetical protein